MNHLKLLHEYLQEKRRLEDVPATGFPFITISRQAGAGGHLLAHVILTDFLKYRDDELFTGWHVFDRELCEVVAEDPEIQASMEDLLSERRRSEIHEFIEGMLTGIPRQYLLQKKTFRIIRVLALLGKVIIVGRAGAMVTSDLPYGVHVRLVASEAARADWMMRKLKTTKDKAMDTLREQDTDRRRLVKTFFDKDIEAPLSYDAVFNSEKMNPHEMSFAMIEMLKFRYAKRKPQ
jgi:cytidylate kinase